MLKRSIDLRKELMSLWNLTKMLRLPTNFTTKIRVTLIVAIVTPLMQRVSSKVIG